MDGFIVPDEAGSWVRASGCRTTWKRFSGIGLPGVPGDRVQERGIPFVPPAPRASFHGSAAEQTLDTRLVAGQIILEINAVKQLCNEARARVHNDLHAARYRLEILVNSAHHAKLEYQRIVL